MSTDHNSNIVGKVLHEFEHLPSTNQYAVDLISNASPAEGTVIVAGYQSQGRGQMGTEWKGEPGQNLMLSVILRPNFLRVSEQFLLNKAVSLSVYQVIKDYLGSYTSIKWPNDIYIGNRKVCGILIQNGIQGTHIQWSVIGIGINVNQKTFGEDLPNATSFYCEQGQTTDLILLRDQLFKQLDHFYALLKEKNDSLDEIYRQTLYRAGISTIFTQSNGEQFVGTIRDVDSLGRLMVEDQAKQLRKYILKEIRYQ